MQIRIDIDVNKGEPMFCVFQYQNIKQEMMECWHSSAASLSVSEDSDLFIQDGRNCG